MVEHHEAHEKPVSTGEMILYGTGTICGGLIGATYNLMTPLMVLALGMNPVLAGLILAVKTLWDAVTDPIMASITDNANTPWGRRRPFILAGGLLSIVTVLAIWTFIPVGDSVRPNVKKESVAIEQPAAQSVEAKSAETAPAVAEAAKEAPPAKPALPVKPPKKSALKTIKEGIALLSHTSAEHKKIFFFMLIMLLVLATTQTIFSVPYYALGIELSPTYHGRTRVVAYRSMFDSTLNGLLSPWYLPFCMLAVFANPIVGMRTLVLILACFGLPGILTATIYTRERTHVDKARKKIGVVSSIVSVMGNHHFLKIAALYIILQLCMGLFMQFSLYINIFHVFGGDQATAMKFGAFMQAKVGTLGGLMALSSIPMITWFCKKFQKHNALRIALFTTASGCILNWFCYTPAHPNLQFILPFFFSLGIASTYTVLSTLMADVTDMDELNTGVRREGMFGAVMAWMTKGVGSIQALAAGALLVATGFDAQLSGQTAETILRMRILFSFVPASVLLLMSFLLWHYPLTRSRMEEVKAILDQRRKDAAAAAAVAKA